MGTLKTRRLKGRVPKTGTEPVAGRTLTIGTRGSRLALRQTELVREALRGRRPELSFEVRQVRTAGDRDRTASLSEIGGQGVFVKELEAALLRHDVDLAVHSLKDVPSEIADGLVLAAILEREDPRDALVSRDGTSLDSLPAGARVGTGSARRAAQLLAHRPDLTPVDIRGNVDTRVRKVEHGELDAAVLAVAGLKRLGLLERAAEILEPEIMVPAVGQGALVVQARADDEETLMLLREIDHRESRLACEAERSFLRRLGGGCRLPFGALATIENDTISLLGFMSDEAGERRFRSQVSGAATEHERLGVELAERLLTDGAAELVEAAETE
ncbi:MAG: hydroxymethylbilane synthase [Chloroflexi bacterium]|nr:hydroxymethylbilane synthase [Chloroflexota bacterium]